MVHAGLCGCKKKATRQPDDTRDDEGKDIYIQLIHTRKLCMFIITVYTVVLLFISACVSTFNAGCAGRSSRGSSIDKAVMDISRFRSVRCQTSWPFSAIAHCTLLESRFGACRASFSPPSPSQPHLDGEVRSGLSPLAKFGQCSPMSDRKLAFDFFTESRRLTREKLRRLRQSRGRIARNELPSWPD